ncbi:hypothetical protein ABW20_dc0107684 [Dactylellina cionopaga]|nr:hypothetical protein ABW20_dc0107684 [Dactylellina cionopaga]
MADGAITGDETQLHSANGEATEVMQIETQGSPKAGPSCHQDSPLMPEPLPSAETSRTPNSQRSPGYENTNGLRADTYLLPGISPVLGTAFGKMAAPEVQWSLTDDQKKQFSQAPEFFSALGVDWNAPEQEQFSTITNFLDPTGEILNLASDVSTQQMQHYPFLNTNRVRSPDRHSIPKYGTVNDSVKHTNTVYPTSTIIYEGHWYTQWA